MSVRLPRGAGPGTRSARRSPDQIDGDHRRLVRDMVSPSSQPLRRRSRSGKSTTRVTVWFRAPGTTSYTWLRARNVASARSGMPYAYGLVLSTFTWSVDPGDQNSREGSPATALRSGRPSFWIAKSPASANVTSVPPASTNVLIASTPACPNPLRYSGGYWFAGGGPKPPPPPPDASPVIRSTPSAGRMSTSKSSIRSPLEDPRVEHGRVREFEVPQQPARPALVHVAAEVALVHGDPLPLDGRALRCQVRLDRIEVHTGRGGDISEQIRRRRSRDDPVAGVALGPAMTALRFRAPDGDIGVQSR